MGKQGKTNKYTLKMELLGNFLTFRNRPWNRPEKGSWLLKRTEKGTKEETSEGSRLWLSLKRPIEIYLEASRSTSCVLLIIVPLNKPFNGQLSGGSF